MFSFAELHVCCFSINLSFSLCPPKRQNILTVPEVDWAEAMQDGWTKRLNNF